MNTLIESGIGSVQRIERERADHIGRIHQNQSRGNCQSSDGQHGLRAIDERDRLFCLKAQRRNLRLLHCFSAGHAFALERRLAFADQGKRQVCQGREIATGAHTALRGNHRMQAAVEQFAEGVND